MVFALVLLAYLLGSIPFGLLLTRRYAGKDVRSEGSGNIGATNVARVAGKKLGAVVLVLDAVKASLAVGLALWLVPGEALVHAGVGYAAFLGHVFPPWLRFKGGKGVATALGSLIVLLPWAALAGAAVWGVIVLTMRVSSVGSLAGAVVALAVAVALGAPKESLGLVVVLLVSMLWTHRENLGRLIRRKENRL